MALNVGRRRLRTRTSLLLLLASVALALGAAIYLVMRPPPMLLEAFGLHSTYRFPAHKHIRWLIGSLPSMLHVYAFSLISISLLEKWTEQTVVATTSFWVVVNLLFEFGQASSLKIFWAGYASDGVVGRLVGYFLYGTFDWNDVGFAVFGGLMAYLTIKGVKTC